MIVTEVGFRVMNSTLEFPVLMKNTTGEIVYMIDSGVGVCIRDENDHGFEGTYAEDWDMDDFDLFMGSITLYNE